MKVRMMTRTSVVRKFKTFLLFEALVLATMLFGTAVFINAQVAFLSSFLIIVASGYAHKKMVEGRIKNGIYADDRDPLDKIDDPHGLFDEEEINDAPPEELDLKAIVKEEKKKLNPFSTSSLKQGLRGSFTLYRIAAYIFLILGFIALKNNNLIDIKIYVVALLPGIIAGYLVLKDE